MPAFPAQQDKHEGKAGEGGEDGKAMEGEAHGEAAQGRTGQGTEAPGDRHHGVDADEVSA